jgi:hypothetical protein
MSEHAATKSCPICAETILESARKCKHCGEFLDGSDGREIHWVDDATVALPRGTVLAGRHCVLCAGTDDLRPWKATYTYATIGDIVRSRDSPVLPRCARCRRTRRIDMLLRLTFGLGGWLFLPMLFGWVAVLVARKAAPTGVALGFGAWALSLVAIALRGRSRDVRCTGIDASFTQLKFPNPEATRTALAEYTLGLEP